VAEQDVIAVLAEHWQDTLPYLSPDDLTLLATWIGVIEAAEHDERAARTALANLTALLAERLPGEHPVSQAMLRGTRLARPSRADLTSIGSTLRVLPGLGSLLRGEPAGEAARTGAGQAGADDPYAWLLSGPALTEQEVRDVGGDPDRVDLIRLPRPDRDTVLPAFQFGPGGRAVPVVATVNLLLDADADPWGAADWWLGKNAWLQGIPAQLLGRVDDSLLVQAARAELPEA
jgi:hypothetical protein